MGGTYRRRVGPFCQLQASVDNVTEISMGFKTWHALEMSSRLPDIVLHVGLVLHAVRCAPQLGDALQGVHMYGIIWIGLHKLRFTSKLSVSYTISVPPCLP
jgi:hypothetical protein